MSTSPESGMVNLLNVDVLIPTLRLLYYNDVSISTFPEGAVYVHGLGLYYVLCVYMILTSHANLTNECRGVLLINRILALSASNFE